MPRHVHAARALAVALALLPMATAQAPAPAPAGTSPEATVISVGDSDTIRVRMNGEPITVRLACIDAPETAQTLFDINLLYALQLHMPVSSVIILHELTTDCLLDDDRSV